MAVKHVVTKGFIGTSNVKFIVTKGFGSFVTAPSDSGWIAEDRNRTWVAGVGCRTFSAVERNRTWVAAQRNNDGA